jgi:hypothetical protein
MKSVSLFVALVTVGAAAASAQIHSTGTGGTAVDPFWSVTCVGIGSFTCPATTGNLSSDAFIPPTIPSPPWEQNAGAAGPNWDSFWASASASNGTGNNATNYDYIFTTTVGAAGAYTLALGWDNQLVSVKDNGTTFYGPQPLSGFCRDADGLLPASAYPNCLTQVTHTFGAGDILTIEIKGDGSTDGIYAASVTPEPATMSLMAMGLVGMAGAGIKRRRNKRS